MWNKNQVILLSFRVLTLVDLKCDTYIGEKPWGGGGRWDGVLVLAATKVTGYKSLTCLDPSSFSFLQLRNSFQ